MKKIFTLVSFILVSVSGFSQFLNVLRPSDSTNISETIYDVSIAPSSTVTTELLVKNISSATLDSVVAQRQILTVDAGDVTSTCWGGTCDNATTNLSSRNLNLTPGQIVTFGQQGFHVIFTASSANVTRLIRFYFYPLHRNLDTISVVIRYNANLGVNELSKVGGTVSNAYPNPVSSNSVIAYKLDDNTQKAKLVFYDVLGKVVKEVMLSGKEGEAKINSGDFNQGIYFYSLIADDRKIVTKKFIVSSK